MDTSQNQQDQQNQDYESLEGVKNIDERVLNTPAKENKVQLPEIDDGQKLDTFMKFNKMPEVKTEDGIVLDLAGEKKEIKDDDLSTSTNSQLFSKVTGNKEVVADSMGSSNALFIMFIIAAGLFGFLLMNFKQTEEMSKLKHEIDRLKSKDNSIF